MRISKRRSGWWITDMPEGYEEYGPYDLTTSGKREAKEDMKGMKLFFKNADNRSFFTGEWKVFRKNKRKGKTS